MVAKIFQALLELLSNDQKYFGFVSVFSLRGEEGLHDHEGDVLMDGLFIAKQGVQTSVNMA